MSILLHRFHSVKENVSQCRHSVIVRPYSPSPRARWLVFDGHNAPGFFLCFHHRSLTHA